MSWHTRYLIAKPQAVRLSSRRKRHRNRFQPSRKVRLILVVITALSLGLILLVALKKPPVLPATTVKAISNEIYQWASKKQQIVATGPLTTLIKQTGERLAHDLEYANIDWTFFVVRNSETSTYALPDGRISLRNDALLLVNRVDDLAAMLAHQMAHVAHGHINERIAKEFNAELLQTLTTESDEWPRLLQALNMSNEEYNFSRKQERLADEFALRLMHKTCFQTHRLAVFWKKIRKTEDSQANFLNTVHPHNAGSISKMEQFIEDNRLQAHINCAQP